MAAGRGGGDAPAVSTGIGIGFDAPNHHHLVVGVVVGMLVLLLRRNNNIMAKAASQSGKSKSKRNQ